MIAKADLEQEHLPVNERSWSFCSLLKRSSRQCTFRVFQKDILVDKARKENVNVMEHYHGENTAGLFKKQPTHDQRTDTVSDSKQRNKDMRFAGRKDR